MPGFDDHIAQLRKEMTGIEEKNARVHHTKNPVLHPADLYRRRQRLKEILEELKCLSEKPQPK